MKERVLSDGTPPPSPDRLKISDDPETTRTEVIRLIISR